ncbi:MAG: putative outer membrane protein [Phenylobacterium sp.]|nr:putative outer membrane protein [Phenylobacterium sp.]MDB5494299.1 putative outer membrane protein [Phenylobacterium sp.]
MLYRPLGAALAVILGGAAQAQPGQDRHFLMDAIRGDNSEMMLGQMAAERGASAGVRDYGRMLHDDHLHARDAAVRVAGRLGVPDTSEMMPEARQEAQKLRRLSGPAFDREFVRYMAKDHRKDVAEFRREAHGRGPVAELAQATLPDLQKHLDTALRLSRG